MVSVCLSPAQEPDCIAIETLWENWPWSSIQTVIADKGYASSAIQSHRARAIIPYTKPSVPSYSPSFHLIAQKMPLSINSEVLLSIFFLLSKRISVLPLVLISVTLPSSLLLPSPYFRLYIPFLFLRFSSKQLSQQCHIKCEYSQNGISIN